MHGTIVVHSMLRGTGDEGDLDKEDSFDAAEALEELRELLHTAEVQRERYALLLQETERERDDAHLHHATTQNALQALQRQYDSLAKDNLVSAITVHVLRVHHIATSCARRCFSHMRS